MRTLEKYYMMLRNGPVAQAEAIDITGAAKWYYEESERDEWNLLTDFPSMTPPYPAVWMEYGDIKRLRFGNHVETLNFPDWRVAAFAAAVQFEDDAQATEAMTQNVMMQVVMRMMGAAKRPVYTDPVAREVDASLRAHLAAGRKARWGLIIFLFGDGMRGFGDGLQQIGGSYFYLDDLGCPLPLASLPILNFVGQDTPAYRVLGADGIANLITNQLMPFAFALSLMNAKNVSFVDTPLPAKVIKRRQREQKAALTFKVLRVEPMRARVKTDASNENTTESESNLRRALHLCRGHFKDYRDGAGLFGKYKGLYWWDSQVRGTDESGRVIKDYKLVHPVK